MKQSDSITKLAAALVAAQAEMPEIPMDGKNPHFGSKFSTLGAVISKTRPVFAEHGLVVLQLPFGEAGNIGLTTRIIHESGEWVEETATMQIGTGANPGQDFGKLITYLRRYSLGAAAGVYSDEDTDNENAQKKVQGAKVTAPPAPNNSPIFSVAQRNALIDAELAKNDFAAKGMLGLSNLPAEATSAEIVAWGKVYRENRYDAEGKNKMTSQEAAAIANEKAGV